MKLSFSISSKSSSSRPPIAKPPQSFNHNDDRNLDDERHDEAKPQFVTVFDPSEKTSANSTLQRVIAPIPNSDSRSHIKMKNLPLPTAEDPSSVTRFTLNTSGNGSSESETSRYGLMLRINGAEGNYQDVDARMSEKRRFQELIKDLPDEELPDVPVEGFGAAILAGFGWSEGKPIGRNTKEDPTVFEYKRRAGTEGFGYAPQAPSLAKKAPKDDISTQIKTGNEKPVHTVDRDERNCESREREKMSQDRKHDEIKREKKRKHSNSTTYEESSIRWLRNNIRVRIISKKFGGGKMYLKKGEVVDVVGPKTCDVRMDGSGQLVQGVNQEILETALPKCGGSVLVLHGKHKGVFGSLVEKSSENETGLVRDADSHALINVQLEQIAEYVGDPSYLGY